MARKTPKPPEGTQSQPSGLTTVKIYADIHRMARTVASYHDQDLTDYLDSILRPAVTQAHKEMGREISEDD